MTESEGVIKFELFHTQAPLHDGIDVCPVNAWRTLFHRLGLISQDSKRYDGYGFGNISFRPSKRSNHFIISGTQTGHIDILGSEHYCEVTDADPEMNRIYSTGLLKPSSEALTHACIYRQDPEIQAVIHVHSPEIWTKTRDLALPFTPDTVLYGTPGMAEAVNTLFTSRQLGTHSVFSMLGHEDGIIAFGRSLETASWALVSCWVKSLYIE